MHTQYYMFIAIEYFSLCCSVTNSFISAHTDTDCSPYVISHTSIMQFLTRVLHTLSDTDVTALSYWWNIFFTQLLCSSSFDIANLPKVTKVWLCMQWEDLGLVIHRNNLKDWESVLRWRLPYVWQGGVLLKNNRVRWQHRRHIHPVTHYLAHIKNLCESIEETCKLYSVSIELILISTHPSLLCLSLWGIKCMKFSTTSELPYSGFTPESISLLIA